MPKLPALLLSVVLATALAAPAGAAEQRWTGPIPESAQSRIFSPVVLAGTAEDAALKAAYVEKMVSGAWAGTMNLTEPQAGSDLALIRCRAEPERAPPSYVT